MPSNPPSPCPLTARTEGEPQPTHKSIERFTLSQDPLLYVDLLSLLPFYIDLILVVSECPEHLTQFTVRSSCTSGADVLGIFRLLRLVRMLKLIRYYAEGSTVLITALSRSLEPLLVPTLFFLLIVFVFGSVMYLLEGLLYENPDFDNIFKAAWFMIVTLSTVGYGDAVPNQPIARVVASVAIICGVLVLAMPISIVGNNFSRVWEERDALLLVARLRTNLRERKLTRQDMRFVFNEFQLDEDDGLIGPGEFRLGLRVLGIQLSAESVGKVFKVFDTDESGSLDFGEFVTQLFPGQTDADTLRDEYEAGVGGKSNPLDEQLRATFRDTFREKRSTRDGGHGDSPPDDASPRTAAAEPTAAQAAAAAAKALSLDQQLDIGRHSPTEHPDTIIEGAMAPAAGGGAPTEHGNAQIKEPPNEVLSPPAPPLSRLHQSSRVFCRSLHAFGSAKRVQAHHGSTRCCTTNPSAKPGAKHPCGHGEMTIGIAKRERELAALIAKVKGSPASPSGGHLAGAMSQHHHSLTAEGGADGGRLEHALAAIEQRLAALEERGTGESCAKSLVAIEARLAGMEVATHPHVSTPAAASSRAPSHWARGVLPSTSRTWQAAGPQRGQLESIEATLRTLADQQHRLLAMGNAGGAGGGGAAGGGGIVADSGAGGGIRRASSGLRRDSAPAHRVPPQLARAGS